MRAERPSLPPRSPAARIQKWTWILIYVGLAALGVGLMVRRDDASLGWTIVTLAGVAIAAGIVLIWIRSRMADPLEKPR